MLLLPANYLGAKNDKSNLFFSQLVGWPEFLIKEYVPFAPQMDSLDELQLHRAWDSRWEWYCRGFQSRAALHTRNCKWPTSKWTSTGTISCILSEWVPLNPQLELDQKLVIIMETLLKSWSLRLWQWKHLGDINSNWNLYEIFVSSRLGWWPSKQHPKEKVWSWNTQFLRG